MQPPTPPFQCKACGFAGNAKIVSKISTAGWVVFALLLLVCLPLFLDRAAHERAPDRMPCMQGSGVSPCSILLHGVG